MIWSKKPSHATVPLNSVPDPELLISICITGLRVRILLFSSVTFKKPKKGKFLKIFFAFYLPKVHPTYTQRTLKSIKKDNKIFIFFAC